MPQSKSERAAKVVELLDGGKKKDATNKDGKTVGNRM